MMAALVFAFFRPRVAEPDTLLWYITVYPSFMLTAHVSYALLMLGGRPAEELP